MNNFDLNNSNNCGCKCNCNHRPDCDHNTIICTKCATGATGPTGPTGPTGAGLDAYGGRYSTAAQTFTTTAGTPTQVTLPTLMATSGSNWASRITRSSRGYWTSRT